MALGWLELCGEGVNPCTKVQHGTNWGSLRGREKVVLSVQLVLG